MAKKVRVQKLIRISVETVDATGSTVVKDWKIVVAPDHGSRVIRFQCAEKPDAGILTIFDHIAHQVVDYV
jgi:hypothetical protein